MFIVKAGAIIACNQGALPTPLNVIRPFIKTQYTPCANVNDFVPMVNIVPFGICRSPMNPAFKPPIIPPCTPIITNPWSASNSSKKLSGCAILTSNATCKCQLGGTISILFAGQMQVKLS